MHRALVVFVTALATARLPAGVPAAVPEARPDARPEARADTIVWRNLLGPRPLDPPEWHDGRAVPVPRLRLGLRTLALPFALGRPPPPDGGGRWLLAPGETWEAWGRARLDRNAGPDALLRRVLLARVERLTGGGGDAAPLRPRSARADPPEVPAGQEGADGFRGMLGGGTELGVRVLGRAEVGGDWSRYRPCLNAFQEACNPRLLPELSPDLRFAVQLGGVIGERLHVDVDFDQLREFEGANTISVVYEGGPDDIIRRLELGDVTFQLPPSRFLTQGIPAGNFGFQATGQLGPWDLRAVWAEQKGDLSTRVFRLTGAGPDRRFVQSDTLVLDDADYVRGQFFFLLDPAEILDHPHVDILSLDGSEASPLVAPGAEPIQLYRYENEPVLRQQVAGFIQAEASAGDGAGRVVESGWFRHLQPGVDYFVHASGLWIALRSPLRRDEMLAVTYVTAAGDTVGDYNPEQIYNAGGRPRLRLLKASAANHRPGRPTWETEMHQVYRVSGSPDVERASVSVTISLGEPSAGRTFKRTSTGEDFTYLRLFGLDQEPPRDEVDAAHVYEPARDLFGDELPTQGAFLGQPPVQGTFLVFPTLRPFAEPPPIPAFGLSEEDAAALLGPDANRRIYEDPDPFERDNGGRFRITVPFRVRSEGVISSFSLGALGVRDGSERIFLGERLLLPGVDYDIDYDVGQVTLRNPETLFAANPDAPVRATWEQRQIFQTAPTSVFGLSARSRVGERGELGLVGVYRSERTLAVRPTLGLEPGAIALGGVNGRATRDVFWLDRLLDRIPGLRVSGRSGFTVDGEMVFSLPTPNTRGDVFLDDFDATADRPLSLLAHDWTRGSAPAFHEGAESVLPAVLDETTFVQTTWQHQWILEGEGGDSVGIREGFFPRQEIDRQIRFAGSEVREPGLRVSFGGRGVLDDARRWASVTTTLSPTGTDLTKSEFLEFYVAQGENLVLVLDLGEVSEDAFFVDGSGLTSGVKENGTPWGLGVLDQEADPARGEIWGDQADQRGVWGEGCVAERGRIYRPGDIRANCTRGNGRRDSEDLNENGVLDVREKYLRWVVRLDGSSPYLVRTRSETGTAFQLYRIPLQGPQAEQVGGVFAEEDMRAVKNIRITVTGERRQALTLARMRVVGARWIRRNQEGVLTGMIGDTLAAFGRVEATAVSRVTEGDAYQSPPGVLERLADPSAAFGGQSIEFNEKSLGVRFEDVQPGDRAEVYDRFPQRPRNFLTYRQARMWVLARSGDWGEDLPHYFFFKVGTDPENFYLYRTRLGRPAPGGVLPSDWLPEVVVDFEQWLDLRRRAEETLILEPRGPASAPVTVWSADSTYAVVLGDRGRAPDLANVREMSFGVWNGGSAPIRGEFWVDELRLAGGVNDAGVASHVNVGLVAADVMESRLTVSNRGAHFRQLGETPTYQTDRLVSFRSTLWLDRLAPAGWGVELPLSFSIDRAAQDPVFLANSDVRADRLHDLRATGDRQTRVTLGFRKVTPSASPLAGALLDGMSGHVGWFSSRAGAITSRHEARGVDARIGYDRRVERRDFSPFPGFLEPVLRFLLPSFLEQPFLDTRIRWSPDRFSLGASWLRHENRIFRFDRIIALEDDDVLVLPTLAPREAMETSGTLSLRPLEPFTADFTLLTSRDLLDPAEAASHPLVRDLIRDERRHLAGVDWGWETHRVVRTRVGFRPRVFEWLRHDVDWTTSFAADRNASYLARHVWGGDTTLVLQRNASGDRSARATFSVDPAEVSRELFGPGPDGGVAMRGALPALLSSLRPLTVTWQDGLASRFNRGPVAPGLGYQLGLGGVERFRFMDVDTASTFTDRTAWQVRWGLGLPAGVGLDVGWSTSTATVLDVRSERDVRDTTWPELQARVESLPVPGPARRVLERVTFSAGYVEGLREVEFGVGGQQRRAVTEREVPLDVTLWWLPGTSTSYRGTFQGGEGTDPTGGTERERMTHRFSISSALSAPRALASTFERPLQLTLILSHVTEQECRASAAQPECVPFVDQLDRSVGLTLGTALHGGFEVGLQSSFTDRQSFVGQRTGSTQFQLGVYGQFLFEAGALPTRQPR